MRMPTGFVLPQRRSGRKLGDGGGSGDFVRPEGAGAQSASSPAGVETGERKDSWHELGLYTSLGRAGIVSSTVGVANIRWACGTSSFPFRWTRPAWNRIASLRVSALCSLELGVRTVRPPELRGMNRRVNVLELWMAEGPKGNWGLV